MPLGPLDWTGDPFLTLYGVLLVAALLVSLIAPRLLRPAGRRATIDDPDQLAVLAGGPTRLAEAMTARLLAAGAMTMPAPGRFHLPPRGAAELLPRAAGVAAIGGELTWGKLAKGVRGHAEGVEARLRRAGLVVDGREQWARQCWAYAPFAMLIAFGLAKVAIGLSRDRPVGYLTALMAVTAIAALVRGHLLARRTDAGEAALHAARDRHQRLRRAPAPGEEALGVALFGTAVLAGSEWAAFHKLRSGNDGSSPSSDGGGGCGGDSGGGCGGCSG